jgi:D-xylose transport system permease protein
MAPALDDQPIALPPSTPVPVTVEGPTAGVVDRTLSGGRADAVLPYVRSWVDRLRGGETGVLPVIAGLIVLIVIFQSKDSAFLSAGNLTNLMVQGSVFILLGMAEVFVLVLGEIDLSTGYVAGIGAVITCELAAEPHNLPWWLCILAGLGATMAIGALQGTLVTRLRLPSFVVTLAGLLGWEGVLIYLINQAGPSNGGVISISNNVLTDIVNGELSVTAGWIVSIGLVVGFGGYLARRDQSRRSTGLAAPPPLVTAMKVALVAIAGLGAAWICNTDRGGVVPLRGIPWVILVVLGILGGWTFLLGRTRFGRYLYAIGGNAEAARRAGVNLTWIRTLAFALSGLTSGAAGIVYASRLGSISTDIDGGTLVLFAVASAVIGGASLFGGRGKMIHALLGGIVIAAIYNGMGLLGLGAAEQYMITALVLLAAVTVDAVARRGRVPS